MERLGDRGVQRGRSRSAVRPRVPAQPLARGRRGRAGAQRGARSPRRDHRRLRHRRSATRRGTGCGPPPSTPASRSASTSRAGRRRASATRWASGSRPRSPPLLPLQLDEPLATMMFCGALERHPGLTLVLAESGVGWLPYFLARCRSGVAQPPRQDRRLHADPAERAVPPPGDGHLRGGRARHGADPAPRRRLVHVGLRLPAHRQHVSRTRGARSKRRSGTLVRRRPRKITVTNCAELYRLARDVLSAVRGVRPRLASDAATQTPWWRSTACSASRSTRLRTSCTVHVGDQMINFHRGRDLAAGRLHPSGTGRGTSVRRPLLRVGRNTGVAARGAGHCRGRRHRGPRRPAGRASHRGHERVRPRPGWQPAGVHDLPPGTSHEAQRRGAVRSRGARRGSWSSAPASAGSPPA